ncbi:MAG TPA: hypothetical protein VFI22_12305, partial [Thermomicrobiales bacterium]|nr:hypothetical protein [Thermomicrobiales bacterium]
GRRLRIAWAASALLVLLAACNADAGRSGEDRRLAGRGLNRSEEATIGAYLRAAADLQTQVAVAVTALPTAERGAPPAPFAQAWSVGVRSVEEVTSLPNYSSQSGDALTIEPRGAFVIVRLAVAYTGSRGSGSFPWWNLRLRDGAGRTFTPQATATASYAVADPDVRRSRQSGKYRPGAIYDEGVVFDVPSNSDELSLRSADNTFSVAISSSEQSSQLSGERGTNEMAKARNYVELRGVRSVDRGTPAR